VKNGAELLDRLLKDIVAETALNYVSKYPENVDLSSNSFGSEHWFERRQDGDIVQGKFPQSSYHHRQHALLHGAGSAAAKTVGIPVQEGNQVRSHPLEDSPVMGAQELPLPIPMNASGQAATSGTLPQPRSQGSMSSNYLVRPSTAGYSNTMNNLVALTDEPKSGAVAASAGAVQGDRTEQGSTTREHSPHGIHATSSGTSKVPLSTSAPGSAALGHHRIFSSHSAIPSTQVNHLSVAGASSASQHSTSPTPSQQPPAPEGGRNESGTPGLVEPGLNLNQTPAAAPAPRLAFSLAKFIPLLSERIYVISPFTRSHLVSWIMILDSVPDLELVSYLPEFLDGLL
jgi:hypothetical protein